MKLGKLGLVAGAFALAICLKPNVGWSTRAYAAVITGEVTAAPQSSEIEIAHHLYHVRANSAAAFKGYIALRSKPARAVTARMRAARSPSPYVLTTLVRSGACGSFQRGPIILCKGTVAL